MEKTWAIRPLELLRHAETHMGRASAVDARLAFISIDNAAELILRIYFSLPRRSRGTPGPSRDEVEKASFPELVQLLSTYAPQSVQELDLYDFDYYHRMRNALYHEGMSLTVDPEYVSKYFDLARQLLERLLSTRYSSGPHPTTRLRPEARTALRARLLKRKSAAHGESVKQALRQLKAKGLTFGRGRRTIGLSDAETVLAISLYKSGFGGYRRIANEINRRRRRRRKPLGPDGEVLEITSQAVRKKLLREGVITSSTDTWKSGRPSKSAN